MIIEELNLIFIHIQKTAGQSIEKIMCDKINSNPNDIYILNKNTYGISHHSFFITHQKCIPNINDYFIFSVVRHPYTRLWSLYNFTFKKKFDENWQKWGIINEDNICVGSYDKFIEFIDYCYIVYNEIKKNYDIKSVDTFESSILLNKYPFILDFCKPQFLYLCNSDKKININKIMKFEKLNEDWEEIKQKFNFSELTEINKTINFNKEYNPNIDLPYKTKQKIYKMMQIDFITFNYNP